FCTFDSNHEHYSYAYASVLGVAIALTAIYYCKMYLTIRTSHLPRRLMLERHPRRKSTGFVSSNEINYFKSSTESSEPKNSQLSLCTTSKIYMNQSSVPKSKILLLTSESNLRRKKLRDELRLINASFKIFLVFLIFWAPVIVVILFFRDRTYYNVPNSVYLFSALLAHSNSTCNVFIYYWANNAFKKFVRHLLEELSVFFSRVVKIELTNFPSKQMHLTEACKISLWCNPPSLLTLGCRPHHCPLIASCPQYLAVASTPRSEFNIKRLIRTSPVKFFYICTFLFVMTNFTQLVCHCHVMPSLRVFAVVAN
uniref:G-protein coupled receptors family 1 profile domain-containing protein n=1 Tax=Romanomermis culicivorax TaxID=13658 RepID=A0A915JLQ3_ROMCU